MRRAQYITKNPVSVHGTGFFNSAIFYFVASVTTSLVFASASLAFTVVELDILCYYEYMSFQAYLDNIETKTGKTPEELIAIATSKGFTSDTKANEIVGWLKDDFDLGRGHAMALVHVIKHGSKISEKHVDSKGAHSDESNTLRLDGLKKR